jgi:hypothetical protein
MTMSVREQVESGTLLLHGEGPRLSTELPVQLLSPRVGFPLSRGTNED